MSLAHHQAYGDMSPICSLASPSSAFLSLPCMRVHWKKEKLILEWPWALIFFLI